MIVNRGTAKVCNACLDLKPLEQFHKSRYNSTGYAKYCKECGIKPGNYSAVARYNQFLEYK